MEAFASMFPDSEFGAVFRDSDFGGVTADELEGAVHRPILSDKRFQKHRDPSGS